MHDGETDPPPLTPSLRQASDVMAGDWIKMEASTPDKAEVLAITATMGWDDVDITVGKLFRVWRWFDQQTVNGNAPGVTPALLDRVAGVSGFAEAMQKVGWLNIKASGITLPNFDRHNGKTAKARALTARRVSDLRKSPEKSNADVTQLPLHDALPREDTRERIESTSKSTDSPASPPPIIHPKRERKVPAGAAKDAVEAFELDDSHRIWAAQNAPSVPVEVEFQAWRDRLRSNGYLAGKTPVRDVAASWRTSMRNAEKWGSYVGKGNGSGSGGANGRRDDRGSATEARRAESVARAAKWGTRVVYDLRDPQPD